MLPGGGSMAAAFHRIGSTYLTIAVSPFPTLTYHRSKGTRLVDQFSFDDVVIIQNQDEGPRTGRICLFGNGVNQLDEHRFD